MSRVWYLLDSGEDWETTPIWEWRQMGFYATREKCRAARAHLWRGVCIESGDLEERRQRWEDED